MKFFLGTHMTEWLKRSAVPLFISAIQLRRRPVRKPAVCDWAGDSGGFTELSTHGCWTVGPQQYIDDVRRWRDTIGRLQWCAIQDWMCEDLILKKTGHTVLEHQMFTIQSWLDLNDLAPEIPWVPVLQGFQPEEYHQHVYLYQRYAGLDLTAVPLVGVGSICRREDTGEAEDIIHSPWKLGMNIHGFGFKIDGLARCSKYLESADSLSWSYRARRAPGPLLAGCTHAKCNNCFPWAMAWRDRVLKSIDLGEINSRQLSIRDFLDAGHFVA